MKIKQSLVKNSIYYEKTWKYSVQFRLILKNTIFKINEIMCVNLTYNLVFRVNFLRTLKKKENLFS